MSNWAVVAELVKTKNLSGALVAQAAPGLPFLLREGVQVVFVPPLLDPPKRAKVLSVTESQDFSAQVVFAGIDNIDIANGLVGKKCLVDLDTLPNNIDSSTPLIVGYQVIDSVQGLLGTVARVDVCPGQSMLVVDTQAEDQAKDHAELLIPFVDAFVLDISDEERTIKVSVPADLLALNRG